MNSYKKLISNSLIFAIGNLGSKIITLLLVPLYTHYLSAEEYGTVDLSITIVSILLPVVSASIFEAILRFVMENKEPRKQIFSNACAVAFLGIISVGFIVPFFYLLNVPAIYLIYIYLILVVQLFEKVLSQFARAIGKLIAFAINGIIIAFTTGLLNVYFLVFLGKGIEGYFQSLIIAYTIAIIYLVISTKAFNYFSIFSIDIPSIKKMLSYSVPLVPHTIMWWLVNASSRFFVLYFIGIGANGLFAVASKVPAIVKIVNTIFSQAWQISAIEEFDNKDKSLFYSNVFNNLSSLMFLGSSLVIVMLKPAFRILFSSEYYEAWEVVPFLLLAAVFSSFSEFLGTNYIVAKETKGILKTSLYGGLISIVLKVSLMPFLGIVGAGVASMISFFIIFVMRYYDTRKYVDVLIVWKKISINLIILSLQILILFFVDNVNKMYFFETTLFCILILVNNNIFSSLRNLKRNKNVEEII